MPTSISRFSQTWKSRLSATLGAPAPHLTLFTIILLVLLYGYEIFNFSLSIDEEVFSHANTLRASIGQGRWAIGLLGWALPPIGSIPMISTILFCAGLGVSACVLARLLFANHAAQWAFAGIFVSSPIWPHIAEFNNLAWGVGLGTLMVVLSLVLVLAGKRLNYILAAGMLAFAIGIYQNFFMWFLVLLCIRYLSAVLGSVPISATDSQARFPWLGGILVALGGLLSYMAVEKLLLTAFSLNLTYIQVMINLHEFVAIPKIAIPRTLGRCWGLLTGSDAIYLGYGRVLMLLPMLGLLIVVVRLLWRGPLTKSQRFLAGGILAAAIGLALSPLVLGAGRIPARVFFTLIPLIAFLAACALAHKVPFKKLLYVALAVALFVSIWINVSLFYSDHIARQRDQLLAARIMARVDLLVSDPPPARIPFVVIGIPSARRGEIGLRRDQQFGVSFFEQNPGIPWRISAYLRLQGVYNLEPRALPVIVQHHPAIAAMPVWPARGSVAFIGDLLVIKLGPLPPA